MAPRMVYFSYPVDQVTGGGNGNLVRRLEQCKFELMDQGVDICYDPGDAFNLRAGAEVGAEIRDVNQAALANADAVLAMLPASQPSVAVPMEIETAVQSGCAVAILTDVAAWTLGYDTRRVNLQLFSLSEDGFAHAVIWLAAQARPVLEERELEALPFTVVRKAECGNGDKHIPHPLGDEVGYCDGLIDLTPRKTYDSDAGFDLVVAKNMTIWPGEQVDVPMGVAVQLPEWSFGRITGRSSTLRKRGLLINEGIIDESYRGELFALAKNLSTHKEEELNVGDRIAQLILHSNVSASVRPVQVQDLSITARGSKGFGSTGL